jgi:hypothetical protein
MPEVAKEKEGLSSSDFSIRLLLSNHEAGIIIGLKGTNIQQLRQNYNCFISISSAEDVGDRVLTATGPMDSIVKVERPLAYTIVTLLT